MVAGYQLEAIIANQSGQWDGAWRGTAVEVVRKKFP